VALLHRRVEVLQEADVLGADEDVHEPAHRAGVVADALLDAGVALLQLGDQLADGAAGGGDLLLALGQLAERGGDADGGDGCSSIRCSNALNVGGMLGPASASPSSASWVLSPLPVMQTTVGSPRPMRPSATRRRHAATVTPPAVSVKMPSVAASSRIASRISSSLTAAAPPPEARMVLSA